MAVNRIPWPSINGATVQQVLLIAGVPGVFVQAGSSLTNVTWTGDPDPAWFPGVSFGSLAKPWLDPADLVIEFRARPVDGTVQVSPVSRTLYDRGAVGSATALFASRSALKFTRLTASVSPTDTTLHVVSTAGFGTRRVHERAGVPRPRDHSRHHHGRRHAHRLDARRVRQPGQAAPWLRATRRPRARASTRAFSPWSAAARTSGSYGSIPRIQHAGLTLSSVLTARWPLAAARPGPAGESRSTAR